VKPTLRVKGIAINDDNALEKEADAMGAASLRANLDPSNHTQLRSRGHMAEKEPTAKGTRRDTVQMAGKGDKFWTLLGLKDWSRPNAPSPFIANNILFASVAKGKVGSIYFPDARIRLVHGRGPQISQHADTKHYTISESDYKLYKKIKKRLSKVKKFQYVTGPQTEKTRYKESKTGPIKEVPNLGCPPAQIGASGRLIEFFGPQGADGSHPSRGAPRRITNVMWNQERINTLYNAAKTGSNWIIRMAMKRDRELKKIPLN
jgi:hypothetical protein